MATAARRYAENGSALAPAGHDFKGALTDPARHEERDFVYMVRTGTKPGSESSVPAREKIESVFDPDRFSSYSVIGQLHAEAAQARLGHPGPLSHLATFGSVGIIVEPASNGHVYVAGRNDLGSELVKEAGHPNSNGGPEAQKGYALRHRGELASPAELLSLSIGNNELLVMGSPDARVTGIFVSPALDRMERQVQLEALADLRLELGYASTPVICLPHAFTINPGVDAETLDRIRFARMLGSVTSAFPEFLSMNDSGFDRSVLSPMPPVLRVVFDSALAEPSGEIVRIAFAEPGSSTKVSYVMGRSAFDEHFVEERHGLYSNASFEAYSEFAALARSYGREIFDARSFAMTFRFNRHSQQARHSVEELNNLRNSEMAAVLEGIVRHGAELAPA